MKSGYNSKTASIIRQHLQDSNLSENEKKVLSLRYAETAESSHTLQSIGSMFGLSKERIRQIEVKGLLKVRKTMLSLIHVV